ncbi:hypothetical protein [Candidatus Nitrosotalea okcheonensis]|uniref:hypothetical protein n=1 Tax=Candidatus Nitrosotalea okcheonensis TaxID=1903276 RepID=UPI001E64243A|nr:hypothetical protein [Candidatus Nitrosotalea okcheonensis]
MIPAFLAHISGTILTELQRNNEMITLSQAMMQIKIPNVVVAVISENRLYNIILSKQAGSHTLTIIGHPGFQIYTFTFG